MMSNPFSRLLERLNAYPWWQVVIELAVIWVVVYAVLRFVQGTRAAGALKGMLLLVLFATLLIRIAGGGAGGGPESFQRLKFLYDHFVTLLAITLIVVFQPELRRGLIRLGETPILRRSAAARRDAIGPVVDACSYLSRARFGGIIVIERETPLKGLVEGGTVINAVVSARLLQSLFFPGSALHDLAVTISGTTLTAAGVQLPLAEPDEMPDPSLGSRHRAAVGLSKECDAIVVVVSEETGGISIAERGRLEQNLDADRLREELAARLGRKSEAPAPPAHSPPAQSGLGDSTLAGMPSPEPAGIGDPRD